MPPVAVSRERLTSLRLRPRARADGWSYSMVSTGTLRFPVGGDEADFRSTFHDGAGAVGQLVQYGRIGTQKLRLYRIFLEHQIISFQFDVCVRIGLGEVSLDFVYMFYQGRPVR